MAREWNELQLATRTPNMNVSTASTPTLDVSSSWWNDITDSAT